jgi:hypothetical protein
VLAGVVVMPRAVSGFSRLRCRGGGEQATILVESVQQTWCGPKRKHALFGDSGGDALGVSFSLLRASLRVTVSWLCGGLMVKTQSYVDVR